MNEVSNVARPREVKGGQGRPREAIDGVAGHMEGQACNGKLIQAKHAMGSICSPG